MRLAFLAAIAFAAAAMPADAATNLVKNGSFETGDFSGWDTSGDEDSFTVTGIQPPTPADGDFYARLAGGDGFEETVLLGQTLNTTVGQEYRITFFVANNDFSGGESINQIRLNWAGARIFTLEGEGSFPFDRYTLKATATTAATSLSFFFQAADGFSYLDNVSVSAVPEPGAWALMILGFGAVGLAARRRATPAAA